ncbi:MAG TPA: COX15/CtaA family protein, partial [bacterium]|nr:COX15/CtaA family protein [bacterium]
ILTLILVLWIQVREKRKRLKYFAWTALGMVAAQALLGGLTVVLMLPALVSIAHACLAQTFFCALIGLSYFLSPLAAQKSSLLTSEEGISRLRRLLTMTTVFIYGQLILGATVRHTQWIGPLAAHIMIAFVVLVHVLLIVLRTARLREDFALKNENALDDLGPLFNALRRFGLGLGVMTICQIFLGMGAFIFTQMLAGGYSPSSGEVFFTVAHQTTGAVILGITFFMTLTVWR